MFQSKTHFYPGLDLLRGFAAISVVVYHAIEHFQWTSFPSDNVVCLWFRLGWMGVDLFFVISGFVVTLSALKLIDRDAQNFTRVYCARRLARIVPLHYLTCLLWVVFVVPAVVFDSRFGWHAFSHLTFTHNWRYWTIGSINGPNWSVGVEMQFYVLVLLLAPWLRRAKPWVVLGGCVAVSWIWRAVAYAQLHGLSRDGVDLLWVRIMQVPGMLDLFGLGIALALVVHRDTTGRFASRCHSVRWLLPLAAALAATATMRIYWINGSNWGNWQMVVLWRTALGGTCLLAVVAACSLNDAWFLTLTAPLRYLGTISYGIYLWHMLVMPSLKPLFPADPGHACVWVLGLTLLLASLSWHFFEKPLMERFGTGASRDDGGRRTVRSVRAILTLGATCDAKTYPYGLDPVAPVLPFWAERRFRWGVPVLFTFVTLWPAWGRIACPTLLGDDITRIVHLVRLSFVDHLFHPYSNHVAPFFQLVSWLTWQVVGHDIRWAPLGYCVASILPWVLVLVLLAFWLLRETGSRTAALAAVALVAQSPLVLKTVYSYSASRFLWAVAFVLIAIIGASAIARRPRLSLVLVGIGSMLGPAAATLGILAAPLAILRGVIEPGSTRRAKLLTILAAVAGIWASVHFSVFGKVGAIERPEWWSTARIEPLAGPGDAFREPGRVLSVLALVGAAGVFAMLLSRWRLIRRCDKQRGLPAVVGTIVGLVSLAIQHDESAGREWALHQPDQKRTIEVLHHVGGLARKEGIPRSQLVRIFDPCFRPWIGSVLHDHPDAFHFMELAAAGPDSVVQPLPDSVARREILGHLTQYERTALGAGACVSFNPPRLSADAKTVAVARRAEMRFAQEVGRGRYHGESGASYIEFEFDRAPPARYLQLPGLRADQDVLILRSDEQGRWRAGLHVRWLGTPRSDGGAAIDIERLIHWPLAPISRIRVQFTRPGEIALSELPRLLR